MTVAGSPTDNQSAISMNNLGASCIATGDLMEAVAHLVNALRYSKDLLQATTAAHEEDFQSSDARLDAGTCPFFTVDAFDDQPCGSLGRPSAVHTNTTTHLES